MQDPAASELRRKIWKTISGKHDLDFVVVVCKLILRLICLSGPQAFCVSVWANTKNQEPVR